MILAAILAPYVAPPMLPSDTGLQAILADCRATSPFTSGPALDVVTPPKSDGLALMIAREVALAEAKHLRLSSRCKEASLALIEAQAMTLQLLRGRNANKA